MHVKSLRFCFVSTGYSDVSGLTTPDFREANKKQIVAANLPPTKWRHPVQCRSTGRERIFDTVSYSPRLHELGGRPRFINSISSTTRSPISRKQE